MRKKLISAAAAVIMTASAVPCVTASAAEQAKNNSVSGYVSLTDGLKLAGADKAPKIYVDNTDYEGVIRAVDDLKSDIESVTDVTPDVTNEIKEQASDGNIQGISVTETGMYISLNEPVPEDAACYIAVYNRDGSLAQVSESDRRINNGNITGGFEFDSVLEKPDGGKIKGFIWQNMRPVTEILGQSAATKVDLDSIDVAIGTIGESKAIENLALQGKLDVSEIEGKQESFTIQRVDNTIVIAGSDKRGTIYGIYDLCEKIGVSPWQWWADAKPSHADELYINLSDDGYTEGEPSVKYRGIFMNDEYNLNQWSNSMGSGNMNPQTYEKIFELVLRLKANCIWPAMHKYSNCFHSNTQNAQTADKYGIIMGSSHAEPLLRNNLGELDAFQDKWESENPDKKLYKAIKNESGKSVAYYWTDHDNNNNAVCNKEFLEAYWRESVKQYGGYENIYTLGMRGVHDGSFQTNMDYPTALNEIIAMQRKIIKEEICDKTGQSIEDIPQVFIPYKDVLKYYNDGSLKVPEDVTIMWTDDNYGYMRQNADDAERSRSGRSGVYYHVSYYGYPTSYLWLSSAQPGLIREELTKSYDMGSDKIWILNVGDLKPAEKEIEYFAKLARNVDQIRNTDIADIYAQNAKRDFNLNDSDAAQYAQIMDEYYELANSKRPEFIRGGEFSLTSYGDEGQRYIDRYNSIVRDAEALYGKIAEDKKAAFYELALYPIRSARNMAVDYIQNDRAKLYSEQGRGAVINRYAQESKNAAAQIDEDTSYYNSMLDGKWNKIMNINPKDLQGCDAHITTSLNPPEVTKLDYTAMNIAVDGQTDLSADPSLTLSKYDTYAKFIDIFNTGYGSFDYTVTSDSSAIDINKTAGTVYDSDRIYVKLDASKAPEGVSRSVITVSQKLGDTVIDTRDIAVTINNQSEITAEKTYIETEGTVSIEAEHYTNAVSNGIYEWQVEKDYGRSGDSVKIYPNLADDVNTNEILSKSAYTEYNVYFEDSGEYTLCAYRMPTLNERGSMKFAVGVDDNNPSVLSGTKAYPSSSSDTRNKNNPWSKGVLSNTEILTSKVTIPNAGYHTIKLYNVSPEVVIDKMVLAKGEIPYSYFGAPESYNTTYNAAGVPLPAKTETMPVNEIEKTYEPDTLVSVLDKTDTQINGVKLIKLTDKYDSAVVAVTAYDSDGNMNAVNFAKADLSQADINEQITVPLNLTLPSDTSGYAVTVFDSFKDLQLIAPYKEYGTITAETEGSSLGIKADLSDYIGRKSITLVADCKITDDIMADNIKYLRGENTAKDSYKRIPFSASQGIYYIRTGINGENAIDETKNTIINITPDNDGVSSVLGTWSFTDALADDDGSNPFATTGGASLTDGHIKMNTTSSGTASMTYANPIVASQGGKITVEFDIYYGKLTGKAMTYDIKDSSNASLASVSLVAYDPSTGASIKIGGSEILENYADLSGVVSRGSNKAADNGPTHYKNVFDFAEGKAYITVSSKKGSAEFSGKFNSDANNIKTINFTTGYNNNERACFVDDVSVSTQTAPQYAISVNAVNTADSLGIDNAVITVTDAVTNAEIIPADGRYMLCEGNYVITVSADGYRTVQYPFELTPALDSKEVYIPMTSRSLESLYE